MSMNNTDLWKVFGERVSGSNVIAVTPHRSYTFTVIAVSSEPDPSGHRSERTVLHLEEVKPKSTHAELLTTIQEATAALVAGDYR